jgi:beta-lactamase regulating signal transducer with metallopeptidase domain
VTLEKVHKFLFYQAHRQKRKRMKGQERMIDHDRSKAEKKYVPLPELCIFLECIMWNNPCVAFKERTLYLFLRNAPCMYFQ